MSTWQIFRLQASSHAPAANDAYVLTVATGPTAGTYLFIDTSGEGLINDGELLVKLSGTSSTTLNIADFIA